MVKTASMRSMDTVSGSPVAQDQTLEARMMDKPLEDLLSVPLIQGQFLIRSRELCHRLNVGMEPHSTSKLVPVSPTGSLYNYVQHLSDKTPSQEAHALVKTASMRSSTMVLENSAEPNHLLTRLVAKTMDLLILLPTS